MTEIMNLQWNHKFAARRMILNKDIHWIPCKAWERQDDSNTVHGIFQISRILDFVSNDVVKAWFTAVRAASSRRLKNRQSHAKHIFICICSTVNQNVPIYCRASVCMHIDLTFGFCTHSIYELVVDTAAGCQDCRWIIQISCPMTFK